MAIKYQPSFDSLMSAGQYYLERGRFDSAASFLENATETNSSSAEAFYLLGVAEERDYQYWSADKAYAHAAALAPDQFAPTYASFRRRVGIAKNNS
jgi:tetratricopeptide (TPR) repeat protein